MNQIEKLATAKAVADKDLKLIVKEVAPGTYPIDCVIRLHGGLTKGLPYRQRIAAAADPWKLLCLALSKLNNASIEALVRESAELPDIGEEDLKAKAKEAIEQIVAGTERECEGKVTASLVWSLQS